MTDRGGRVSILCSDLITSNGIHFFRQVNIHLNAKIVEIQTPFYASSMPDIYKQSLSTNVSSIAHCPFCPYLLPAFSYPARASSLEFSCVGDGARGIYRVGDVRGRKGGERVREATGIRGVEHLGGSSGRSGG